MQGHTIWMEERFLIHNNDTVFEYSDRAIADARLAEMQKMAGISAVAKKSKAKAKKAKGK